MTTPLPPAAWFERLDLAPWLLLVPLVWLLLRRLDRRRAHARLAFLGSRVMRTTPGPSPRRLAAARSLFALGLLLGGLAWLHPSLGERAPAPAWRGADVVVALDVSRSMRARDLAPDRLARAQAEIRALAEAASGDRLGLVLFAGEARVRAPLTRDRAAVAMLASAATPDDVALGGTDLAAALDAAGGLIARGAESQGAVLLLTDGEDHAGRGRAAAARLAARGIAVHVLGLGSERGARIPHHPAPDSQETYLKDRSGSDVLTRLDAPGLAALASAGGGTFVRAEGTQPALPDLHRGALLTRARARAEQQGRERPANHFQILLALALVCFAADIALRAPRGARRVGRHRPGAVTTPPAAPVRTVPGVPLATRVGATLLLLSLGACGARDDAEDHARAGRHREALAAYEATLAREGARAPPETHVNVALCALHVGDLERALRASREAEKRGGAAFLPWAAFVRGNVAFTRSLAAEADAQRPDGDPALLERALVLTEDALAAWRLAASSRSDWPEARRNVERALLRLDDLREKQKTGAGAKRTPVVVKPPPGPGEPTTEPPPPTPPGPPPTQPSPEPRPEAAADVDPGARVLTTDLAPDDLVRVPDLLRTKAQQRAAARRADRARTSREVEKDW